MSKILIVVDMQNDFVTGTLGSEAAQGIVPAVARAIRDGGFDTVYATRDTHEAARYARTLEGQKLPVDHCFAGTPGWEICPEVAAALAERSDCQYFDKTTFGCVPLAKTLQAKLDPARDSVALAGLCTDICVAANAILLRAFCPDLPICVLAYAAAGTTPENHRAALQTMAANQVDVVETETEERVNR